MTARTKKIYINTIAEYHCLAGLPAPVHPLVSVVKFEDLRWEPDNHFTSIVRHFYTIALKKNINTAFRYGQGEIDFREGVLHFMLPGQVLTLKKPAEEITNSGYQLLFHPDLLWNTALAEKIKQYEYFHYRFNKALPLSAEDEALVVDIIQKIDKEHQNSTDKNSHDIIIAHIELLLAYAERFYQRQYIGEKKDEHRLLTRLELLLNEYFNNDRLAQQGIPTIRYISDQLHVSPNYLSRLLKRITGQSTQPYLHDKLIELAKEKLSATGLSVSEVAYELGFNSPQSFSKLFRKKTSLTPLEFRKSFDWPG